MGVRELFRFFDSYLFNKARNSPTHSIHGRRFVFIPWGVIEREVRSPLGFDNYVVLVE